MKTKLIAAALLITAASTALADDRCTTEPRNKWLGTNDMKTRVEQTGLTVQRLETDDGCYEVHGVRANGDRVKLTLHPVSGAVMEEEIKYANAAQPAQRAVNAASAPSGR